MVLCLVLALSWFGWFDNPENNPGDRPAEIRAVAGTANVTMSVVPWRAAEWDAARASGQRVIVMMPNELFWAVQTGTAPSDPMPQPVSPDTPMWTRPGEWEGQTLRDWVALIDAHRDEVAGVMLTDELGCNSDDGTVRFLQWNPESCRRAAAKLRILYELITTWLPGIDTWSNETAAWMHYALLAQVYQVPLSRYGVTMLPTTYVSFDCYTRFASCFGPRVSVERLVQATKPWLRRDQRVVLMPRAFLGYDPVTQWDPSLTELHQLRREYEAYIAREPAVGGVVSFLWRPTMNGAGASFALASPWLDWGRRALGLPLPSPPAPPVNVHIVQEVP